jgi:hypothetical protein
MNKMKRCIAWASMGLTITMSVVLADDASPPNAGMRYVSGSVLSDDQGSQQLLSNVSLTVGDSAWITGGVGRSRSELQNSIYQPVILSAGAGVAGDAWQAVLNFTDRYDADIFQQRDWKGAIDWHNGTINLGIDGLQRTAHAEGTLTTSDTQSGTTTVPVTQRIRGTGIGAHLRVNATDRLSLFAAGIKYHFNVIAAQSTTVATSNPGNIISNALANKPLLSQSTLTRTSLVTRDEATLTRSYGGGVTYQFDRVGLTAEYLNDQIHDLPGDVTTVQLKAAIDVTPHWQLVPGIGNSHSDQYGAVTYGLVTVSYGW